jgi:hypothetical protein
MSTHSSLDVFEQIVAQQIVQFPSAKIFQRIEAGDIKVAHYHTILTTLFHQTYCGPYTFARAAVNCDWRHEAAKDYLLKHAEEERTHWRWVLDDLRSSGYTGPNVRELPPPPSCLAYMGLNYAVADIMPVARLATAAVLEGIGAAHGGHYGRLLLKALHLSPAQATFFLSHAETDKKHSVELREVIAACDLSNDEWRWMHRTAESAGHFYRAMYDQESFN